MNGTGWERLVEKGIHPGHQDGSLFGRIGIEGSTKELLL